ncbi:hypothetical protein L0666_05305 [Octadecabacter sp. CECT 8868]|uniref:hypothetical protein n=1 Tax=Octadecabacter algicola TaxID=2909342 RepID=UPI001F3AD891|nr:hypothetical protein [Octadecabacter algicola]MCF2904395.1 hypothetical protein [Octadecabacter algicola]
MKFAKIFAAVAALMLLAIILMVVTDLIWGAVALAIGNALGLPWLNGISGIWVFAALIFVLPKQYIWGKIAKMIGFDGPYVCHATLDIDASVAEVWDEVRLRPRDDYYQPTMKRITAVAGEPNRFDLHVDERLTADGDIPMRIEAVIEEKVENFYLRLGYLNAETLPLFGKDLVSTEIWMEREAGKTRITYAENLSQLTLTTALAFLFLNPAKDGLKQLKSRCEGTPDTSWMGKTMRGVGPNGEVDSQTQGTMTAVLASVLIVTTLMVAGVMWFVMSLPT